MKVTYRDEYDGMQIKLEFKTLQSGKRQVKFYTKNLLRENYYGYTLVDPKKDLPHIVALIKKKILNINSIGNYYQQHLFSIKREPREADNFVIYKSR
jgi:hypothetical protein